VTRPNFTLTTDTEFGEECRGTGKIMAVILIVEDEEQVRVLADSFLQAEGNKTLSAATIEQALALIEGEEPVDLLFVDLKIQDDVEGGLRIEPDEPASEKRTFECQPAKTRRSKSSKMVRSVIGYAIRPSSAKSLRSLSNT
jgi:response regulator of citrate/malate metabolism